MTGEIRDMLIDFEGVLSVSPNSVAFHTRGGAPIFTVKNDKMRDLTQISYSKFDNSEFVVGSNNAALFVIDFYTGRVVREVPMPCAIKTLCRARGVWCGLANGDISMLDPRTWRVEHSLSAHKADVRSTDIKGDLLASCGCSPRNGQLFTDPVVKVFDVKTLRNLPPIQFKRPYMVKFHPKFYSSVAVISETSNQIQISDIQLDQNPPSQQNFSIDNLYGCVQSFDMSSSGEIMAFGDTGSIIHQWAEKDNVRVNVHSYALEFGSYPQFSKPKRMEDDWPLSVVDFTPDESQLVDGNNQVILNSSTNTELASYWKPTLSYPVGLPTRPLNPSLLQHLKQHDFVGYITNTGISRKQFRTKTYEDGKSHKTLSNLALSSISHVRPPKSYRWMEIRFTKLGIDEFDTTVHNKTKFSGLENCLLNTYSNCCIQTLYFIPHIRNSLLNHLCQKNYCLSCELGFVFHMMDQSSGKAVVETSNFLRVLKQFPQAENLGLCLSHDQPEAPIPLSQLITNFNRFLIEQIHKDLLKQEPNSNSNNNNNNNNNKSSKHQQHNHHHQQQHNHNHNQTIPATAVGGESIIDGLFGSNVISSNKCVNCGNQYEKTSRHFQFDLQYPNSASELGPEGVTFANLLRTSLSKQIKTPAWCEKCQNYFSTIQKKNPLTLPNILCLNANVSKKEYEDYWKFTSNNLTGTVNPSQDGELEFENETTWLPIRIRMNIDNETNQLNVTEYKNTGSLCTDPESNDEVTKDGVLYELVSLISHVKDQVKRLPKQGHLVSQCRLTDFYFEGIPSPVQQPSFYLFNDFKVKPCTINDVAHFDSNWKTPAVLFYRRVGFEKMANNGVGAIPTLCNPITKEVYMANNLITCNPQTVSFVPPTYETLPKTDDIVAIDTEFVSIGPEETEVSSDGKRVIIQPGNFSLARASLVRLNGEAFLDDYIQSIEPVTDYLTRFSGIQPGDLDPKISTKNVVSLKSCYIKLRYLVDQRVIFVGHGLKKDFRIINIYVPPEQIIDTVEIFQLRNQRKLSLRFLAHILLNTDIQTETHCSIEDAKSAMELYKQYQILVKNKEFEETLNKIYQIGRKLNFKVPENPTDMISIK
ncbi:WD40-like domain-containing protein [Cavenderia fasciculata]|uniref:WD40-like domain-containing protein n=1 Tax=Cavenderia fasciculata TaxID=261658 RepID=F4PTB9_CACFS|nr:WD40-like domain-containing protein [Cavenderia fasciculata]EGG21641.1 WD40-like domain-containing protein [Cavenderia fasciculata]|eukprot:XP_004359491.1 WD40-like domain-containing protein [Cavenderia fasciculata]